MKAIKTAYRWEANWKITLLVVLLLPLLLKLGFWQLSRAEDKRELARQLSERQAMQAMEWHDLVVAHTATFDSATLNSATLSHRRVLLHGRYRQDAVYLLDNQVFNGSVGFQVLQLFEIEVADDTSTEAIPLKSALVNRGWIRGYADRSIPQIDTPGESASLVASIFIPSSDPLVLAEDNWDDLWPKVIQSVDMDKIVRHSGPGLFPYELRIEPGEWSALTVDWPAINTGPEKHLGYAVQWFAMAIALVVAWLFASIRKHPQAGTNC